MFILPVIITVECVYFLLKAHGFKIFTGQWGFHPGQKKKNVIKTHEKNKGFRAVTVGELKV